MTAHRELDRIGDDLAGDQRRLHALVTHGDAVGDGDRRELAGHAARLDHAPFGRLGLAPERDVAGRRLVPGADDTDERPRDLLRREPHGVVVRAVRRPLRADGGVPARELGLVVDGDGGHGPASSLPEAAHHSDGHPCSPDVRREARHAKCRRPVSPEGRPCRPPAPRTDRGARPRPVEVAISSSRQSTPAIHSQAAPHAPRPASAAMPGTRRAGATERSARRTVPAVSRHRRGTVGRRSSGPASGDRGRDRRSHRRRQIAHGLSVDPLVHGKGGMLRIEGSRAVAQAPSLSSQAHGQASDVQTVVIEHRDLVRMIGKAGASQDRRPAWSSRCRAWPAGGGSRRRCA